MKDSVKEMVKKYNPEHGLIINKRVNLIEDFLSNEIVISYDIKGEMKYIRFILANAINDLSKFIIIENVILEDGKTQITYIFQEEKFHSNNRTFNVGEFPILNLSMIKDNHLEMKILMQKNNLTELDKELIDMIDSYFYELILDINSRIIKQDICFEGIKKELTLTMHKENEVEEEIKPSKKKKESKNG